MIVPELTPFPHSCFSLPGWVAITHYNVTIQLLIGRVDEAANPPLANSEPIGSAVRSCLFHHIIQRGHYVVLHFSCGGAYMSSGIRWKNWQKFSGQLRHNHEHLAQVQGLSVIQVIRFDKQAKVKSQVHYQQKSKVVMVTTYLYQTVKWPFVYGMWWTADPQLSLIH